MEHRRIKDMEEIKETFRLQFTAALEVYNDFVNFCNGASFADGCGSNRICTIWNK